MVPNFPKRSYYGAQALLFHIKSPLIRICRRRNSPTPSYLTMFALLTGLACMAIAVVSAQDPAVFNTSSTLFGTLTDCGTSGPPSCGGDPSDQNLCCYESPGVRWILVSWRTPKLTHVLRGCCCKRRYVRGSALDFHECDYERGLVMSVLGYKAVNGAC